jgi:hypothetical protein
MKKHRKNPERTFANSVVPGAKSRIGTEFENSGRNSAGICNLVWRGVHPKSEHFSMMAYG